MPFFDTLTTLSFFTIFHQRNFFLIKISTKKQRAKHRTGGELERVKILVLFSFAINLVSILARFGSRVWIREATSLELAQKLGRKMMQNIENILRNILRDIIV